MKKYIFVLIIGVLIISTSSQASWLQGYVDNFKQNAPTVFKTPSRTSIGLGGVSIRTRPRTDPLFSIEPPRIKAGCGGIDIYMGSFAYLNPEYLLDKLKKIIKIAPAAAFQLALGVLCDPCKNVMNTLEEIAQLFNSLQLDECAAAKALVATVASPFVDNPQKQAELQNVISDFKVSSGLDNFTRKINEGFGKKGSSDNPTETNTKLTEGCSTPFKDTFFQTGSLLSNLFEQTKYGNTEYNKEVVEILRGWIGDVSISVDETADGFKYTVVPPCGNSNADSAYSVGKALTSGHFERKKNLTSASCEKSTLNNGKSMYEYVSETLGDIMDKMSQGANVSGSYTTDQIAIILTPGVPVPLLLKQAVYTNDPGLKTALSEVISQAIVVNGMIEAIETLKKMINTAFELSSKEASKVAPAAGTICNTQLAQGALELLQKMLERANQVETEIYRFKHSEVDMAIKDIMEKIDLGRRLEVQLRQQFMQELAVINTKKR